VRGGIQCDRVEVCDMADLVRALGSGVLTSHDFAAQVDGDGVRAVHAAFLAKGLDGPPALDGRVEFIDALAERLALRHWREQGARLNPVLLISTLFKYSRRRLWHGALNESRPLYLPLNNVEVAPPDDSAG
jgi:hypothetical protein